MCFIALISMNACTPNFLVGDAVSVVATDKTIGDHIVSYVSKKDCSTVRTELGMTYCKEDEPKDKSPKIHCYNELGKVTCYEQPEIDASRHEVEQKTENPKVWR
jgi:hypothetical protein